jgi:biopolymer transport protein ExbB/TolQ
MNPEPPSESTLRFWRRALFASIGMVVIPPLFGLAGTVIAMIRSFQELSATGTSNPEALANGISASLTTTAIGATISGVGLIFFIVCLIRYLTLRKYRSQPS